MSVAQKAVEDLQQFANRFKPLFDLADGLSKLGSIEQATSEAEAKRLKAIEDAEKAEALKAEKVKQYKEAESVVAEAHKKAQAIESVASEKANSIIRAASQNAQEIVAKADKHRKDLDVECKGKSQELAQLSSLVNGKHEELLMVKKQIEEVKAKLQAFMKG